ncbi:MAG TPA: hypothetical protein VGC41_08140 [Kofleriaceae bacterium]
MATTLHGLDLESKVANRKHELIMQMVERKRHSARFGAGEDIVRIEGLLTELAQITPTNWEDVEHKAKLRLAEWIKR